MKSILTAVCTIFVLCVTAQTTNPPALNNKANPGGVYLKGGMNLANISTTPNGRVDEANLLTSFHVGLMNDMPLGDAFSFQLGLLFTGKGSKTEIYNNPNNYYRIRTNPLYLEVPLNFVFKVPFGNDSRLFLGAGPYVAMGVGGKTRGEQRLLGITSNYERNIQFNDDDPLTPGQEDASVNKLRRFDYGANALFGLEVNKLLLGINYGYGLAKIGSAQANEDDYNKHRVWSISLGFQL